jgi:hypothetical protein
MWIHWPFRVAISLATTLLALQAVFAGQFLDGTYDALRLHRENATVAGIVVLVAAAAAVPIWRPGRGPLWPVLASLGLFALIAAQIAIGFARLIAVHVPLGITIIGLALRLTWYAWRHPSAAAAEAVSVTPGADA